MNSRALLCSFVAFAGFCASIVPVTNGCLVAGEDTETLVATTDDDLSSNVSCTLDQPRYPTVSSDMDHLYANRSFLVDNVHLGNDMALAEGTPIYAIGCGVVRVYRSATGYGRLVVVIEHRLATPLKVVNGNGETVTITSFFTIYGHLRVSQDANGTVGVLGIKAGDLVGPNDVIGYVDQASTNGDGGVHLHFGVRLQTAQDAATTDTAWFRGYDSNPSQRKWFANPKTFMQTLTSSVMPVLWHPPGTVLQHPTDGTYWMVGANGTRMLIDQATVQCEGLASRAVHGTAGEFACFEPALGPYASLRGQHMVAKFSDASTVYEFDDYAPGSRRWTFISYEAFLSWGWHDGDIKIWDPSDRPAFMAWAFNQGYRTVRDGTLVKAEGESEVSIVSEERRLPIVDWPTFLALDLDPNQIFTIQKSTIDVVAGPRGPLITPALISQCLSPNNGNGQNATTQVPVGKVLFRYTGPASGAIQLWGMWDPPGSAFYDWTPQTSALCPDTSPGDSRLECLLDMPSGTVNFTFTVRLPDGRWWGDESCAPSGGCGSTLGTVDLATPNGTLSYQLVSNGSGSSYKNGYVAVVP